jgi:hypothetical protein
LATGCQALIPSGIGAEVEHDSGLLVDGRDSRGLLKEDSLNVAKAYLDWQRPLSRRATIYTALGVGYKFDEGGFETSGSKWVGNIRTGVRFSLDRN